MINFRHGWPLLFKRPQRWPRPPESAFRRRVRLFCNALPGAVAAFWKGYAEEATCALGCLFVVAALWPAVGVFALIVPGIVLLWVALPQREPFIKKPHPETKERRKIA